MATSSGEPPEPQAGRLGANLTEFGWVHVAVKVNRTVRIDDLDFRLHMGFAERADAPTALISYLGLPFEGTGGTPSQSGRCVYGKLDHAAGKSCGPFPVWDEKVTGRNLAYWGEAGEKYAIRDPTLNYFLTLSEAHPSPPVTMDLKWRNTTANWSYGPPSDTFILRAMNFEEGPGGQRTATIDVPVGRSIFFDFFLTLPPWDPLGESTPRPSYQRPNGTTQKVQPTDRIEISNQSGRWTFTLPPAPAPDPNEPPALWGAIFTPTRLRDSRR